MSVLRVQVCEFYIDRPDRPAADQELQRTPRFREIVFIVVSLLLRSEVMTLTQVGSSRCRKVVPQRIYARPKGAADAVILKLTSEGFSFREISKLLGKSLGSVTGRYYRLKGVRHPSRIMRDAGLKKNRKLRRTTREKERSMAAIQAAIELRRGVKFSIAVGGRAAGASLEMIGACCGVSQLHWRRNPEKAMIGTVYNARSDTPQSFRYASLSDIIRKALGGHQIAVAQTTHIDRAAGLVNLTTVLLHTSGEWLSSDWPVCQLSESAVPRRMGAALT
jgi:hypothetical protein